MGGDLHICRSRPCTAYNGGQCRGCKPALGRLQFRPLYLCTVFPRLNARAFIFFGVRFTRRLYGAGVYFSLLRPRHIDRTASQLPPSKLFRPHPQPAASTLHRTIACASPTSGTRETGWWQALARITPRGHCHSLPFDPAFN